MSHKNRNNKKIKYFMKNNKKRKFLNLNEFTATQHKGSNFHLKWETFAVKSDKIRILYLRPVQVHTISND